MSIDQYGEFMMGEFENGIGDTGIRPGHIKVGITNLTSQQEKMLRAAGRVSAMTGFSITVHPGFNIGSGGPRIVDILTEEGVAPQRVIIGHSDCFLPYYDFRSLVLNPHEWSLNLDRQKALLDRGTNLSMDLFGNRWSLEVTGFVMDEDWHRIGGLIALLKQGYSHQIVLGTDTSMKILTRRGGGMGYCRLTNFVVPTLRQLGVSDFDIRQMTTANPARLLSAAS
jgi:phosphotriesterase-related protein